MRIISGTYKGRRLTAPKSLPVRPTTDFAKEGLFNILRNRYEFATLAVLDLFAGTGNISYEFASRGVSQIVAVDSHFGCVKYINKVSEEFGFPIQTIKADVEKYVNMQKGSYDIIFADPPYSFDTETISRITTKVFENNLLKNDGILIIEHAKHTDLSQLTHYEESRKYGISVFSFFS